MSTNNVVNIGAIVVIVVLIGSVVAMALNGTITGDVALAFLAPLATLAGGIIAHATGVASGTTAAATGAAAATGQGPNPASLKAQQ